MQPINLIHDFREKQKAGHHHIKCKCLINIKIISISHMLSMRRNVLQLKNIV